MQTNRYHTYLFAMMESSRHQRMEHVHMVLFIDNKESDSIVHTLIKSSSSSIIHELASRIEPKSFSHDATKRYV